MLLQMVVRDFKSDFDAAIDTLPLYPSPFDSPSLCVALQGRFPVGADGRGWAGDPIERLGPLSGVARVDDGSQITGNLRWGWFDMEGNPPEFGALSGWGLAVCFVPAAPLEEGWHVFRVDFSPWTEFGTRLMPYGTDGVVYARFHVGSRPTWYETEVDCWEDGRRSGLPDSACLITGFVSEEVVSWGSTTIEVSFDGVPTECSPWLEPGSAGFAALCPFRADGNQVEVAVVSDVIADVHGSGERRHLVAMPVGGVRHRELLDPNFGLDVFEAP